MRKAVMILFTAALFVCLIFSVSAASGANKVVCQATVSPDGTCQVSQIISLRLDDPARELTYPIPGNASAVTLNGSRVSARKSGDVRLVDLSKVVGKVAGEFTLNIGYRLSGLVQTADTGVQELTLPMLSGFAYPIDRLEFSVSMPTEVTVKPAFSSGYHQSSIESALDVSVSGAVINGVSGQMLKDHETLEMKLGVPESVFPKNITTLPSLDRLNIFMYVSVGLALLYWLAFLFFLPQARTPSTTAPDGCTAGQLGSVLQQKGTDLHLMILSWAQLGYVALHIERGGRITVHKRMEMGNERSTFEQRCYTMLFRKSDVVDTSSRRYALLCRDIRQSRAELAPFLQRHSGSVKIFRVLAALCGVLGCVGIALTLGNGAALRWLAVVVFAAGGLVGCIFIQSWAYALYSPDRRPIRTALVLCCVIFLLSLLAGNPSLGLLVCLSQLAAGLLAAFGGRRTASGKQAISQTLGLRRYLGTVSSEEVQRICANSPDFFFAMLPNALALGADERFAGRFGKMPMPECPYLSGCAQIHTTARSWGAEMRSVYRAMARREQRLPYERIGQIFADFRRR